MFENGSRKSQMPGKKETEIIVKSKIIEHSIQQKQQLSSSE